MMALHRMSLSDVPIYLSYSLGRWVNGVNAVVRMYVSNIVHMLTMAVLSDQTTLRILYCEYSSHFQDLLGNTSIESILTTRIKCVVFEVFKSLYKLNAPCRHDDIFKINNTSYDVRVTKLEQPMQRTTNYGLRTFSYIGSRSWNLLV